MKYLLIGCCAAALCSRIAAAESLSSKSLKVEVKGAQINSLTNVLTRELLVTQSNIKPKIGLHRLGETEMRADKADKQDRQVTTVSITQTAEWHKADGSSRAAMRTIYTIDKPTGDIIVTQTGNAVNKGLYGISWALGDVSQTAETLVPGNSGQRFGSDAPSGLRDFDYPIGWEAPFVIIQGIRGGVIIRAEDPSYRFKNLIVERSSHSTRMRFESRNTAPFEQLTHITSSRWRITPFKGNWQVGAALYREWAKKRYAMTPMEAKQPAWAKEIQFVVIMSMDIPTLEALARRCVPKQTLLYIPNWRKDDYDRNYPDYTAFPEFGPFLTAAHKLGFRVMPHVNYFGCDPKNPLYETYRRWQIRDPFSKELQWWDWKKAEPPIKFAYINPASSAWRKLFISRMVDIVKQYPVDAFHLDQTLCIYNDDNGLIDGMNCIEGNIALHRELRQALPNIAISGEGLDEVTCLYEQFAQRHLWGLNHAEGTWDDRTIAMSHAISSAVLSPYTKIYGYLGMANPNASGLYTAWQQGYEHFGVLPTYAWPDVSQLDKPTPAITALLEHAEFFQKFQPRDNFTAPWQPEDLFVYRLNDGRSAFYRRDKGVIFGVKTKDDKQTIITQRLEGVNSVVLGGSVADWPAYDAKLLFGFDPRRVYDWSPKPRDLKAPHIASLPKGSYITQSGLQKTFARFRIVHAVAAPVQLWAYDGESSGGVTLPDGSITKSDEAFFEDPATGGISRSFSNGIFMQPPYKGIDPKTAAHRCIVFAEFDLHLVKTESIQFQCNVALNTGAQGKSDGVLFRVKAIGGAKTLSAEVFNANETHASLVLDLSELRGQRIKLRLETDPGPAGDPSFDWAFFDRPTVVNGSTDATKPATIDLANMGDKLTPLVSTGEVNSAVLPGGGMRIYLGLPNTLIVPFIKPTDIALPCDLLHTSFVSGVLFADGIERPGYSYFQGISRTAICAGETRNALSLHPPPNGRTIADYWLKLPAEPVQLRTAVGILDGSKSTGVGFEIQVNGRSVFTKSLKPASGWIPAEVDLSEWAGKPVLLSLISDSEGDYTFDWAVWGTPVIMAK